MRIYDPADQEYEPALRFFRECTKIPVHAHFKVAKAAFLFFIGTVVIALVWHTGRLS